MAKLIVSEYVTLDGVMEAPGGEPTHPHTGWAFDHHTPDMEQYKLDEVMEAESLLLGRVTYEGFSAAWPGRDGEFADKMNGMPKYVASTTLSDPAWSNTTVLDGDVADAAAALKQRQDGPVLVAGSCSLLHALIRAGVVDEYRLMIFPVLLGSGLRWYPESPDKLRLDLAGTQSFSSGVVVHTYTPSAG